MLKMHTVFVIRLFVLFFFEYSKNIVLKMNWKTRIRMRKHRAISVLFDWYVIIEPFVLAQISGAKSLGCPLYNKADRRRGTRPKGSQGQESSGRRQTQGGLV
jgi:hypothetical protein